MADLRYVFIRDMTMYHIHEVEGRIETGHDHHCGLRPHIHARSYQAASQAATRSFITYQGLKLFWQEYSHDAFWIGRLYDMP